MAAVASHQGARARRALPAPYALPISAHDTGVAQFLRPEEEIVDFWPRPELDQLTDWVASGEHAALQLVTGQGGVGKTRLARQLARHAQPMGYRSWWARADGSLPVVEEMRDYGQPALMVVDYAETQADLRNTLGMVFAHRDGAPLRVLLLARSAGEWWQQLIDGSAYEVSEALAAIQPIALGPLPDDTGQARVFRQALSAFAAKLQLPCPNAELTVADPNAPVLIVHAAALLAVLTHTDGQDRTDVRSGADVLAGLLRHEARYWRRSQAVYGLSMSTEVIRRAVALGCLIGADDEERAGTLLEVLPDLADPATRGRAARWLHDLYPLPGLPTALPDWIGPLRPDRLTEQLAATVLREQPGLIPRLFSGLRQRRAARALTVLARAALADPAALPLIAAALEADLENLAVPALEVAVETNPAVAGLLQGALITSVLSPATFERSADALPYPTVALAETAVIVHSRLAELTADDPAMRARHLINLCSSLGRLRHHEQALTAVDEAVALYRQLAAARPDEFRRHLADALHSQSLCLSTLGRKEQALAPIDETVAVYRQLAAARPDEFRPELAKALHSQGACLFGLWRWEQALAAIDGAVVIWRELATGKPDAFGQNLTLALNGQSLCLKSLGRWEQASAAIDEAVAMNRKLAAARPDVFGMDLAIALANQSAHLAEVGRQEEALAAIEEAVTVNRHHAAARPDTLRPALASTLSMQSLCLKALGRYEEALAAIEEAVTVNRELAAISPDAFDPQLAGALDILANVLGALGREREAAAAHAEAQALHGQT